MKKIMLFIFSILLAALQVQGQDWISNGESGLSVRTKLNNLYKQVEDTIVNDIDTLKLLKMYFTTVDVNASEFNLLHTDSVVVIPASGTDTYINVINAICRVESAGTPDIAFGNLYLSYNTAADGAISSEDVISMITYAQINVTGEHQYLTQPNDNVLGSLEEQQANLSVVLWLTDQNTGDDATLKIYVTYQILYK
jgi:hypothetical protein